MNPFILLGLVLALAALAFVVYPLLAPSAEPAGVARHSREADERRQVIYRQILEIEFDQQLGKLDQADAQALSASLLREAAGLLVETSGTEIDVEAVVEREIRAVREALAAARRSELGPVAS